MVKKSFAEDILERFSKAEKTAVAFSYFDGTSVKEKTFAQFHQDILTATGYFREHEIRGQHIALMGINSYDWFVAYFAIISSGNVAVLVNPDLPDYMICELCGKADVTQFCVEPSIAAESREVFHGYRMMTYKDLYEANPVSAENVYKADEQETIMLVFTSGTTGKSKAAEITSGNMWYITNICDYAYDSPQKKRLYFTIPAYHIAGMKFALEALSRSYTVCIGRGIRYMLLDMPLFNPTYLVLVPTMAESLVKVLKRTRDRKEQEKYIGSGLQRISLVAAPARPAVYLFLLELGFTIEVCYGMTETTGDGLWCTYENEHIGATGKPRAELQCRFQDGELLMKGPSIMKGYYRDPEETAKIMEDGWIHTGDLGYRDGAGYHYLTGRSKNVIILSNGENVNPEEVEKKFGECDAIVECLVYSDGKGICVDVYTENEDAVAEYIKEYNNEMPTYRQVYKVNYTAIPLEKTGTGKIKRKENR